jgi:hypothetical protein
MPKITGFAKYGYASNISQNLAIALPHPVNQSESSGNVAQRLLQAGCIIPSITHHVLIHHGIAHHWQRYAVITHHW